MKIKKTIEEQDLIARGDKVVLGLSGGPDSLCLLSILNSLKDELGFSLYALHVNHMIRGKDADDDEAFLRDYCAEAGVELKVVKVDVPAIAKEQGLSEEEAGRNIRHQALSEFGADKIALAHNKNDQAETVLMRILRGTGTKGLCAMEFKRADGIIRPLLNTGRREIEDCCRENNLSPRMDKTNEETDYTRNKIRLQLLPALKEYNPEIEEALVRLSENAREDEQLLTELALQSKTTDVKKLAQLPDAIFSRVIISMFADSGLTEDIGAVHIKALRVAIKKNVGGKTIEFPHNYKATITKGQLVISKIPDK